MSKPDPGVGSKKDFRQALKREFENTQDQREESLIRLFAQSVFAIFLVVFTAIVLGITIRSEVIEISKQVVQHIGYLGLFIGMVLSDSLPAFVPPDAFLMFSIASGMDAFWTLFTTSAGSIVGGGIAYSVGRFLIPRFSLGRKVVLKYEDKLVPYVRRFGFWAVVLSAITPIPYSWMAYTAGTFQMKPLLFFLGSLFRILRMTLYYYAILWGWVQ